MSTSFSIGFAAGKYLDSQPTISGPVTVAGIGSYAGAKAGHYIASRADILDENSHGGLIGGAISGALGDGVGGALTTGKPGGIAGSIGCAIVGGYIGHPVDKDNF